MNWKIILAILLSLFLAGAAAGYIRDSRLDADFPAIRAKSSEADVRHVMGEPRQVLHPCQAYDTSVTPDCTHVFLYRSIFYPLREKYWLVFFDENNQVTATSSELEP